MNDAEKKSGRKADLTFLNFYTLEAVRLRLPYASKKIGFLQKIINMTE